MKRRMSFSEYRMIDIVIFALLAIVFEYIISRAQRSIFFADQAFAVSLQAALTAIVYMRWSGFGAIIACITGFSYCFFNEGTIYQYMIYIAGNLFSVLSVLFLLKLGKTRVMESMWLTMAYGILVLLLMQGGRAVVSLLLGYDASLAMGFFLTDILTDLFTLLILYIVRRLDGVFEDQKHYLLRVNNE